MGDAVELRVTSLPIVVGDHVVGMYGVAEDVTAANQLHRDPETGRAAAEQATVAKSLPTARVWTSTASSTRPFRRACTVTRPGSSRC